METGHECNADAYKPWDSEAGIYRKYAVVRLNDVNNKHGNCEYFVLDLTHDKHAAAALKSYARSCADDYPVLAKELRAKVKAMTKGAK